MRNICLFILIVCSIDYICASGHSKKSGAAPKIITPIQYGLKDAKTGEERFYVLLRTHKEAERLGAGVSYVGIDEIKLVIPKGTNSIPITHYTDFAGVKLNVENQQRDIYLFLLTTKLQPVNVKGKEIDNCDFSKNNILRSGEKLLIVKDKTLWIEKRMGHDYGLTRKDIMLVKNGKASNGPVQSYLSKVSNPEGYYCDVAKKPRLIFKNLTLNRTENSTYKTYLVKIENQYDVALSGITINTPQNSDMYGDRAIYIVNCLKIFMSDITINGTYSQSKNAEYGKKYGYGISLDNTYDFSASNIYARAKWGVFGNNNVHKAVLKNCDINRFDIHCYGKDISFEDCNFVDLYTSLGSVFGLISYTNCTFTNYKPILTGGGEVHVGYDVYFKNCTFYFNEKKCSIIELNKFFKTENSRPELKEKCLPNVTMINCRVNVPKEKKKWYIYNTAKTKGYEGCFNHISKVVIHNLTTNDSNAKMCIFSKEIKSKNKININIK